MPIFLGKHTLPNGLSNGEIEQGWEKYKSAATARGLKALHVNYSLEKGFAYCETDAPNAQEVQKAHEAAQVPLEEIIQVVQSE